MLEQSALAMRVIFLIIFLLSVAEISVFQPGQRFTRQSVTLFQNLSPEMHSQRGLEGSTIDRADQWRFYFTPFLRAAFDAFPEVRPPLSFGDILDWLSDKFIVDLGAGERLFLVNWLRSTGAQNVHGIDIAFSNGAADGDANLHRVSLQSRWPFNDGEVQVFLSFNVLGKDVPGLPEYRGYWSDGKDLEQDYDAIAGELKRTMADSGIGILDLGAFGNEKLIENLQKEGLVISDFGDLHIYVTKIPLDAFLGNLKNEIVASLRGVKNRPALTDL